ncbi:hypothetical protein BCL90_1114 [Pedobacter alluvionis]|uniref:Uncharacterized protein n=1 Tax=Pedobacter alluvionis TaxID=475253 RepID=A0A497Y9Y6_9SPHI|nr:hypothetical protein BCL90_1114 [Pedobacter alluvionis]
MAIELPSAEQVDLADSCDLLSLFELLIFTTTSGMPLMAPDTL